MSLKTIQKAVIKRKLYKNSWKCFNYKASKEFLKFILKNSGIQLNLRLAENQ